MGGVADPSAICQTNRLILDPKPVLDSTGPELSEYVAKFYMNVTDDVTGWVKGQIVEHLSLFASPGKAAVSD